MRAFLRTVWASARDLLPIVLVIGVFQFAVLKQSLPDIGSILLGLLWVVLGLTLFVYGLERALFPIGETLAHSLAKKGSLFWLLLFAFGLGFGTTIAEPALTAIAAKAAQIAAEGQLIEASEAGQQRYALGLRLCVALSVGLAILLGVLRILKGWPLVTMIIIGYGLVLLTTLMAPASIIGIAYDSGGVTTSTITVPLVTALGVGLSSVIAGRNPMLDGFGLIALASLLPMIFVMLYGMVMLG